MNSKIKTLTTISLTLAGVLAFQKKDSIWSYLRSIRRCNSKNSLPSEDNCGCEAIHENPEVTINYPQSEFAFTYPLTGIVLENMASVNMVIDRLQSFFERNNCMTVADLFGICGLSRFGTSRDCQIDFNFGWPTLDDFKIKIHEIGNGKNVLFEYHLVVPDPELLHAEDLGVNK